MIPSRWVPGAALGVLVLVLAWSAHAPALDASFVDYDDDAYVTDNPHVRDGVSWSGLRWALQATHAANWHPLTWLSHQLDVEVWGLDPRGHHATSVTLHAFNALLLFVWLRALTGRTVASASVALLFAVHPLRVESVAWIAERKDVLSGTFALLALAAYTSWARRGGSGRYALVLLALAAGLAAKPMLVTLPFVFLLLDVWPLERWHRSDRWARLREKLPFFAMSAASCAVTLVAQRAGGAVASIEAIALPARTANAVVSYVLYLAKVFWPVDLALLYPHPALLGSGRGWLAVAASVGALASLTVLFALARRRRWLLVGWLWFLGTLVPVIGIVQVGQQGLADRYTYLPAIGLTLAVVWTLADLATTRARRLAATVASAVVIGALILASRAQARHWRDSIALYTHAIEVTGGSPVLHTNLGAALEHAGDPESARKHYLRAIELGPADAGAHHNLSRLALASGDVTQALEHARLAASLAPEWADSHVCLGNALAALGRHREAAAAFRRAAEIDPHDPAIRFNLGNALGAGGSFDEAVAAYRKAAELDPRSAAAHVNLGNLILSRGDLTEARTHFERALAVDPASPEAWYGLGIVLARTARGAEAVASYVEAARLRPAWPAPVIAAAWVLATDPDPAVRDGARAVQLAEQARTLAGTDARALDTLAAALAEIGRFSEAAEAAAEAGRLAELTGDHAYAARARERRSGYLEGRPYRSRPAPDGGRTSSAIQSSPSS